MVLVLVAASLQLVVALGVECRQSLRRSRAEFAGMGPLHIG